MNLNSCSREKEVARQLALGQWPEASTSELRAHAAACRSCGDLVLVTQSFQRARAQATAEAPVASSGAIWWRAQLRRRNEAIERVGKPILGAQIFALSVYLLLVAGFLASQARHGLSWLTWLEGLPQAGAGRLQDFWPSTLLSSGWSLTLLIPVLATLALLGGVAVYLTSEKQ
jgi:hypothetical protein